ncbi:MAG: DNA-3-methyladenine glycosylase [Bacteroidales bacterium]|nr:DNA-3-methyladenine glycosylase [Bacteroidales bacterium]
MVLDRDFYTQEDVVFIAKHLIGKVLYTRIDDAICSGIIMETEAYAGINDKASHAYANKITKRTQIMYFEGGCAYIYLIYGMYSLFNVVTNKAGTPHAVLIRSILPFEGLEKMKQRRNGNQIGLKDGIGPGRLSKLLGIDYSLSGITLAKKRVENAIWIEDKGIILSENGIRRGKRIGVEYAKEDAELPYRFWIESEKIDLVKKITKPVDEGNSFF